MINRQNQHRLQTVLAISVLATAAGCSDGGKAAQAAEDLKAIRAIQERAEQQAAAGAAKEKANFDARRAGIRAEAERRTAGASAAKP